MKDKINGEPERSKITVVLGAQWGDEGKGKVVDLLAEKADRSLTIRNYAIS